MALWKRKHTYYIDIAAPDGSRIRRSSGTSDRRKAQEYHDRLKSELWDEARLNRKPKRTWDEAALRWLNEKKHKRSYADDVFRIRFFTRFLRGKVLGSISRDLIDQIITKHLSHTKPATKDLYAALIRAIFRIAMREWEWIETMPAFKFYLKGGNARVRWLTQEQATRLLQELPEHQQDLMLFGLATGLRQGNIRKLRWSQLNLARKLATIDHDQTKNGQALGIPLNALAMSVLERRIGQHEDFVFTYRGRPIGQVNTKAWTQALVRAGIENFRWHDLRHTWASWLRQNDVPTWALQEMGGWKSEAMVRRYAHLSAKHLEPYSDLLMYVPKNTHTQVTDNGKGCGTKSPTRRAHPALYLVK